MFNFFGLELKNIEVDLQGEKNIAEIPTIITFEDTK